VVFAGKSPRVGMSRIFLGAGWSSPVARQAHNLKAAGSNPAPATNFIITQSPLRANLGGFFVWSCIGSRAFCAQPWLDVWVLDRLSRSLKGACRVSWRRLHPLEPAFADQNIGTITPAGRGCKCWLS
jgi:hypothetical protein